MIFLLLAQKEYAKRLSLVHRLSGSKETLGDPDATSINKLMSWNAKKSLPVILLFLVILSCKPWKGIQKGSPYLQVYSLYDDERFPNVVVAKDGSIVTSWGSDDFRIRRSEDGGITWSPAATIAKPGFQGGGMIVDENTGDILLFVEEHHPVAPMKMFRSKDHGKTWNEENFGIQPNSLGHIPSMHMNDHGITIQHGAYAGRLIRPSRYYGKGNDRAYWDDHYTNAIYSDDGGNTWRASEPFPARGTGEACIAELSDGTLYYNSRRHKSTDGQNPRRRYAARSHDGGRTWVEMNVVEALPDGDQNRDYGLMGGLTKLPLDSQDVLLFSNIDSPEGRKSGTIWVSFDGGRSWPTKKLIEPGSFAYSSLAVGREGTASEGLVYLLYESDRKGKIAIFNTSWLLDGISKKSLPMN